MTEAIHTAIQAHHVVYTSLAWLANPNLTLTRVFNLVPGTRVPKNFPIPGNSLPEIMLGFTLRENSRNATSHCGYVP